jgi:hypothetical protein
MSAMGERFLLLEETADALDVINPELATQFRVVNGLPGPASVSVPGWADAPTADATPEVPVHHEIAMTVEDDRIRSTCSCGGWATDVRWDDLEAMVLQVREHLGAAEASTRDGIPAAGPSTAAELGRRAG